MNENSNTEKNNPITVIRECSVPSEADLTERAGFVYLLNRIQKLEKKEDEESSPKNYVLPLSQKYSLNVEEAAVYFGIGERRLRQMAYEHQGEEFLLEIGSHIRFKRALFERFLDKLSAV